MFEMQWWCYVVSAVLAVPVAIDARRRGLTPWAIAGWTAVVAVTWIGVVPYVALRNRSGSNDTTENERAPV